MESLTGQAHTPASCEKCEMLIDLGILGDGPSGFWVYQRGLLLGLRESLELQPELAEKFTRITICGRGSPEKKKFLEEFLSSEGKFNLSFSPMARMSRRYSFLQWLFTAHRSRGQLYHSTINILPLFSVQKAVLTIHDFLQAFPVQKDARAYIFLRSQIYRFLIRRSIRKAQLLIVGHEITKDFLLQKFKPRKTVHVLYPPLEEQFLTHEITPLSSENLFIVFASGDTRKNELTALRVLERSSARVVLVCSSERVKRRVQSSKEYQRVANRVRFEVSVSSQRLVELYQQSRGCIFPSLGEGFGYPIYEAVSLGLPVVTNKEFLVKKLSDDVRLMIHDADIRSPESIAQALDRLEAQNLRFETRLRASQEVRELLSPVRFAEELLKAYSQLEDETL